MVKKSFFILSIFIIQMLFLTGLLAADSQEFEVVSKDNKQITINVGSADGISKGLTGIIYSKETIGGKTEYLPIGTFKVSQVNSSSCIAEITKIIPSSTEDVLKLYVRFDKKLIKKVIINQEVKQVSEASVTHDKDIKPTKVSSDEVPEGKDLAFYYSKANELFSEKKFSEAKAYFEKLQKMLPEDKHIEKQLKEIDEILSKKQLPEQDKDKLEYYKLVFTNSIKNGDYEGVKEYFDKIRRINPNDTSLDILFKGINPQEIINSNEMKEVCFIALGNYVYKTDAENMGKKIKTAGYPAYIKTEIQFNRVFIGGFKNLAIANIVKNFILDDKDFPELNKRKLEIMTYAEMQKDLPLFADGVNVKKPECYDKPTPYYPDLAKAARIKGAVVLQVLWDTNGRIMDAKVLSSPGRQFGFDDAAIEAVKKWKCYPVTVDGRNVEIYGTVTINFL